MCTNRPFNREKLIGETCKSSFASPRSAMSSHPTDAPCPNMSRSIDSTRGTSGMPSCAQYTLYFNLGSFEPWLSPPLPRLLFAPPFRAPRPLLTPLPRPPRPPPLSPACPRFAPPLFQPFLLPLLTPPPGLASLAARGGCCTGTAAFVLTLGPPAGATLEDGSGGWDGSMRGDAAAFPPPTAAEGAPVRLERARRGGTVGFTPSTLLTSLFLPPILGGDRFDPGAAFCWLWLRPCPKGAAPPTFAGPPPLLLRGTRGLTPDLGGECCAAPAPATAPGCGRFGNLARLTQAGKWGTGDAVALSSEARGECFENGSYGEEDETVDGGPHSVGTASPLASSWRRATPLARSGLRCSPRCARPILVPSALSSTSVLLSFNSSCFEGASGAGGIDLTSSIIFVQSTVSSASFCITLAHLAPRSGS